MTLTGMMHRGRRFEHNFEHDRHERGEKECALILFLSGFGEQTVELLRRKKPLKNGSHEHGERGFLFKAVENLIVSTHGDSLQMRQTGKKITGLENAKNNNFAKTWEYQII